MEFNTVDQARLVASKMAPVSGQGFCWYLWCLNSWERYGQVHCFLLLNCPNVRVFLATLERATFSYSAFKSTNNVIAWYSNNTRLMQHDRCRRQLFEPVHCAAPGSALSKLDRMPCCQALLGYGRRLLTPTHAPSLTWEKKVSADDVHHTVSMNIASTHHRYTRNSSQNIQAQLAMQWMISNQLRYLKVRVAFRGTFPP